MIATVAHSHDLRRWVLSAAVVVGLHAALVVILTRWHEHVTGDEGNDAIVVDLAPFTGPSTESKNDLAPGPEQQQSTASPDVQPLKPEEKPQEKIERPPVLPDADVQLPLEVKPPDKPVEQPSPPVPQATSPPRPRPSAAQVASWHRRIALQVERHKGYPASARARHETGTAELAFTLDRTGKVVASRVVRTSGFAALDQETIDTVRRAAPFPPPPENLSGETFDFTVPIRFNIR
jgi:periplasmic protein TonB